MIRSFTDLLALAALLFWPAIPLFWIPVHCIPRFFRRLGFFTYLLPVLTWLPVAYATFTMRDALLSHRIAMPMGVNAAGVLLLVLGAGLQTWTLSLLTLSGIMGMPEVTTEVTGKLMTRGPFAILRHPTYLSHTMMLLGVFLWTEVAVLGIVMIIDALVVNIAVIPLEERELLERFGAAYEDYCRKVPYRFLPLRRPR
jgi:protein-S-isoprenylcysteine O-methyltransferase Ste14